MIIYEFVDKKDAHISHFIFQDTIVAQVHILHIVTCVMLKIYTKTHV